MGLAGVELLCEVERRFALEIGAEEAEGLATVGALNALVARRLAERASQAGRLVAPEPELTWPLLVPLIVETYGVAPEAVRPDSRWADLRRG